MKIVCEGPSSKPITVQMVGAGGILQLDAATCEAGSDVVAIAHTPALVAYLPSAIVARGGLPPARRGGPPPGRSRLADAVPPALRECALLAMPIAGRVLHQLRVLARDFGRAHPAGRLHRPPAQPRRSRGHGGRGTRQRDPCGRRAACGRPPGAGSGTLRPRGRCLSDLIPRTHALGRRSRRDGSSKPRPRAARSELTRSPGTAAHPRRCACTPSAPGGTRTPRPTALPAGAGTSGVVAAARRS